jgi:glycosidase
MKEAVEAMAVLAFTFDGMPLMYSGQEEPLTKRLQFFEKDPIGWETYSKQVFYTKLLDLKHRNAALWNGKAGGSVVRLKTSKDEQLYAYYREKDNQRVLVILNLSETPSTAIVDCSACEGIYTDVFKGSTLEIKNEHTVDLGAWGYLLMENKSRGGMK